MARREIRNARVLITGASSGIGEALARAMVAGGAKVLLTARRQDRLDQLAGELSAESGEVSVLAGDVTDGEHRRKLLGVMQAEYGGIDILVNNAGVGAIGHFVKADDRRLRSVMEVNFFAVAEFVREAYPMLKDSLAQGSSPAIVNVGSVLGHTAVPGKSEYCASKFALHGFNDSLRNELKREGIDVILISPSTTKSEFTDSLLEDRGGTAKNPYGMTPDAVAAHMIRGIRSGRREIILSISGTLLVWLDRICPPLASVILRRFG